MDAIDTNSQISEFRQLVLIKTLTEGDAVPLEKSLRVLRQNAHDGLEHLAKRVQPQPD